MDQTPKQQIAEKLRDSSNVLIAVSNSPNVDQLASAIGLSLMLVKLDKHATAVFSGDVPDTMQFLDPQKRFDKSIDGLRDFIISLDKDKADKLRYKVEDDVVKIFITPYRGQITKDDLMYSQGDFNVDAVVALGVSRREDLDTAIINHGRILHDATIMTISSGDQSDGFGSIHWNDNQASSISEMLVSISESLQSNLIDDATATALLTGIVSATERFSNDKTSPKVMTMAAQLMAAGANQQLIAHNLQLDNVSQSKPKKDDDSPDEKPATKQEDKTALQIQRDQPDSKPKSETPPEPVKDTQEQPDLADENKNQIDQKADSGSDADKPKSLSELEDELGAHQYAEPEQKTPSVGAKPDDSNSYLNPERNKVVEPLSQPEKADKPNLGGTFNATSRDAQEEKEKEEDVNRRILSHDGTQSESQDQTQTTDEESHEAELEEARKALEQAASSTQPQIPKPKENLASQPMVENGTENEIQIDESGTFKIPGHSDSQSDSNQASSPPPPQSSQPPSAPPVPPPMPKPPQDNQ